MIRYDRSYFRYQNTSDWYFFYKAFIEMVYGFDEAASLHWKRDDFHN